MAESVECEPSGSDAAEWIAAIEHTLEEIKRSRARMRVHQLNIDRPKAETHALRDESRAIRADTCAILDSLAARP